MGDRFLMNSEACEWISGELRSVNLLIADEVLVITRRVVLNLEDRKSY